MPGCTALQCLQCWARLPITFLQLLLLQYLSLKLSGWVAAGSADGEAPPKPSIKLPAGAASLSSAASTSRHNADLFNAIIMVWGRNAEHNL
jgi:hypothetical protein